jgi:hypothetical protein
MSDSNFDKFIQLATQNEVFLKLNFGEKRNPDAAGGPDALFHVPLIALTVLVLAVKSKKSLRVMEAATWLGMVIANVFHGYRGARQNIRWSFVMRQRCVDALSFLELAGFIVITDDDERTIVATDVGKKMVRDLGQSESDVGVLIRGLGRAVSKSEAAGLELI